MGDRRPNRRTSASVGGPVRYDGQRPRTPFTPSTALTPERHYARSIELPFRYIGSTLS